MRAQAAALAERRKATLERRENVLTKVAVVLAALCFNEATDIPPIVHFTELHSRFSPQLGFSSCILLSTTLPSLKPADQIQIQHAAKTAAINIRSFRMSIVFTFK